MHKKVTESFWLGRSQLLAKFDDFCQKLKKVSSVGAQHSAVAFRVKNGFSGWPAGCVTISGFTANYHLLIIGPCDTNNKMKIYLRSEEHTSELQSLMRISYAVFC